MKVASSAQSTSRFAAAVAAVSIVLGLLISGAPCQGADTQPPVGQGATQTPAQISPQTPAKALPAQSVVTPAAKPFLGVNVDENSANFDPAQGLPITVVIPGSTAATLGLTPGDHLTGFNGQPLHAQADLVHALQQIKVGDTITVQYSRKQGDKTDIKTASGIITERPQVRTLNRDLNTLRDDVQRLRTQVDEKKQKEISLIEVLRQLKELEQNLPAAVADFKKQYPNGEFNISIKIDISSDKNAKQVIEIGNQQGADLKTTDPGAKGDDKQTTTPPTTPKP